MKIKVGYKNYNIVHEKEVLDDEKEECFGLIEYDNETIRISDKYPRNMQMQTIVHELVHAVADKYHLEINKSEREIDCMANGIYEIILDNPEKINKFLNEIIIRRDEINE